MSKKMRDPFAEYDAALQAEKMILRKIQEFSEMGMDKPDVIETINKLSMGLVRIQSIRDEAKKQYNEQVAYTRQLLDEAEAAFQTESESSLKAGLLALTKVFNNVFQTEPLGEEDGPKIERKED